MNIKPIKTEVDYNQALKRLDEIFNAPHDSSEGVEAELLVSLVADYEDEYFAIENDNLLD